MYGFKLEGNTKGMGSEDYAKLKYNKPVSYGNLSVFFDTVTDMYSSLSGQDIEMLKNGKISMQQIKNRRLKAIGEKEIEVIKITQQGTGKIVHDGKGIYPTELAALNAINVISSYGRVSVSINVGEKIQFATLVQKKPRRAVVVAANIPVCNSSVFEMINEFDAYCGENCSVALRFNNPQVKGLAVAYQDLGTGLKGASGIVKYAWVGNRLIILTCE